MFVTVYRVARNLQVVLDVFNLYWHQGWKNHRATPWNKINTSAAIKFQYLYHFIPVFGRYRMQSYRTHRVPSHGCGNNYFFTMLLIYPSPGSQRRPAHSVISPCRTRPWTIAHEGRPQQHVEDLWGSYQVVLLADLRRILTVVKSTTGRTGTRIAVSGAVRTEGTSAHKVLCPTYRQW